MSLSDNEQYYCTCGDSFNGPKEEVARAAYNHSADMLGTGDDHIIRRVPPQTLTMSESETGGKKILKPEMLGAVDPLALRALGKVAYHGQKKYDRYNYLKGYAWSNSIDAMYRHFLQFQEGVDYDEESGLPHTVHAGWHALALTSFLERGLGTDDRFKG